MSGYVWDLSGTDNRCSSYGPSHQIHWIHFNQHTDPSRALGDMCRGLLIAHESGNRANESSPGGDRAPT